MPPAGGLAKTAEGGSYDAGPLLQKSQKRFHSTRIIWIACLAEAGIDVLVVTSKHNIQYLFGGYRFFFFDYMDAIGVSRYLPILVYRRRKAGGRLLHRLSHGGV